MHCRAPQRYWETAADGSIDNVDWYCIVNGKHCTEVEERRSPSCLLLLLIGFNSKRRHPPSPEIGLYYPPNKTALRHREDASKEVNNMTAYICGGRQDQKDPTVQGKKERFLLIAPFYHQLMSEITFNSSSSALGNPLRQSLPP